jgi:undecaprenyl-diphosphatase
MPSVPPLYAHDPFLAVQHALARPWLDPVMAAVTIACEGWALALLAAAFVAWRERRLRESVQVLAPLYLALTLAGLVVQVLKEIIATPRPLAVLGPAAVHVVLEPLYENGFPSGHSASVAAVAVFLLARYRARAWPLAVLALLGGTSRVYVGAHWVTDVLGGWTIGAILALVATPLLEAATRGVRAVRSARRGSARDDGARMEPLREPQVVALDAKPEPIDRERP